MSEKIVSKVRRALPTDAPLLASLGAQTFSETFAPYNTEEDMAQYLAESFNVEHQHAELADEATCFLIADINNEPAGYAMLRRGKPPTGVVARPPIELVRLYVSKQWLGQGVGETLMRACLHEARQQGCQTLWLGVWEHNARARAFYRKWQFEEFGEHSFQLGGDLQNDFLMRRSVFE